MNMVLYDGTFEGFLSVVFYAYENKIVPGSIQHEKNFQDSFFAEKYQVSTEEKKARRVWNGIIKKASKHASQKIYSAFLSEMPGTEMLLFNLIRLIFDSPVNIETDFSNEYVLQTDKVFRKVMREAERVRMFVRFQKTADDIYYALFEPMYDVLPIAVKHFEDRFSDQKWMIYDVKRDYGFFYDLKEVKDIRLTNSDINLETGRASPDILGNEEQLFQKLWQNYYDSTTIKERKNRKVHMQFLPRRFWKFLPEKARY